VAAVLAAKGLERLPIFRVQPASSKRSYAKPLPTKATTPNGSLERSPIQESDSLRPLSRCSAALMTLFLLFFLYLFVRSAFPASLLTPPRPFAPALVAANLNRTVFVAVLDAISKLSIPLLLSAFPLYAMLRHVKVYEEFVDGAKEGFEVAVRIIPYLVAILVAIAMFRAAGGIDLLGRILAPITLAVGFPSELLPLVLMRPLSGSGTLGIFTELVKQFGSDSQIARMAGTIFGSTETTFYVLAVYFGSVGIKRTRYAVVAGLTADFVGVVASVLLCRWVF